MSSAMRSAARPFQRRSVQTYTNIGLETEVLGASPVQLIALLMDGALAAMRKARLHMQAGNVQGRGAAISRAIDLVESGLKASLKRDEGDKAVQALADNLMLTYDAVVHHLLQANLHARAESLDVAESLLNNVCQAWKQATGAAGSGA